MRVILGEHDGVSSPVTSPSGINYLLVTLQPGELWTYEPPAGPDAAFMALSAGAVDVGSTLAAGDMAVFGPSGPMSFQADASAGAPFVIGSAIPHPHDLVLGYYSVHTSTKALASGEARIAELAATLPSGDPNVKGRSVPVFRAGRPGRSLARGPRSSLWHLQGARMLCPPRNGPHPAPL